ncbi:uncharacterized protein LOC134835499 [Culicoides brevitarsis]|uniref:uncharacterized protein LOC134835499 n=1 Tax=Culicoides brevitarsis TaxID=469753 RepID=UPI00307C5F79
MANVLNSARSMSPAVSGHSVIAVKKFQGLSLEPNNNELQHRQSIRTRVVPCLGVILLFYMITKVILVPSPQNGHSTISENSAFDINNNSHHVTNLQHAAKTYNYAARDYRKTTNSGVSKNTQRHFVRNNSKYSGNKYANVYRNVKSDANNENSFKTTTTTTKNFDRYITRVTISDDFLQTEIGSDQAEAVTKEEEIITKRKTELTTTKQIETRVKRKVKLEDGKVIEDSGPIIETNTTEDHDKQESETTERRNLGQPVAADPKKAIDFTDTNDKLALTEDDTACERKLVPRPKDGLMREITDNVKVSREVRNERVETEDVHHLGDFSDKAYVAAINSGVENVAAVLFSEEAQRQLVPQGPRVVSETYNSNKVIDSEDIETKYLAQKDGTTITEQKKTTQHEEEYDDEIPEADDKSTGSREKIDHTESHQRYFKQRDEQLVDHVIDGEVYKTEMRYAAEQEQMERDGPKEAIDDWDSLSDRLRKQRRNQKSLLQRQKEAAALLDRTDALTKRPLDVDREEETRKTETSKWLDSHFGSESSARSSTEESHDDLVIEPTKKTFFNVTIKSSPTTPTPSSTPSPKLMSPSNPQVILPERESPKKYFQGITEWSERKTPPAARPLISKEFQEKLSGTLQRNHRLRQETAVKEELRPVKSFPLNGRESILKTYKEDDYATPNKPKFGSQIRSSVDSDTETFKRDDLGYLSGSRNDVRYRPEGLSMKNSFSNGHLTRQDSGFIRESREDLHKFSRNEPKDAVDDVPIKASSIQRDDSAYISSSTYFTTPRSRPVINRTPDSGIKSPSPPSPETTLYHPTVPERKRALERKMKSTGNLAQRSPSPIKRPEPRPDYSPRSQSRSNSPSPPVIAQTPTTLQKKQYQKTRFSEVATPRKKGPAPPPPIPPPVMPQNGAKDTKTKNVGAAIGNSIRKLVGKIRSASAERKIKMKSSGKHRSPSPQHKQQQKIQKQDSVNGNNTYQQYNVIDGHINGNKKSHFRRSTEGGEQRESSIGSGSFAVNRRNSSDLDVVTTNGNGEMITSPRQRYYLGENPYAGSIYGKENRYEGARPQRNFSRRQRSEEPQQYHVKSSYQPSNTTTLGRFSKSTNRLVSDTTDYRNNSQTLPRTLDHHHKPLHSSTINVSVINTVQKPLANTGPAKPARSYKALNRSKSFNVHGLNGTDDPNPIFIEKINGHPRYGSNLSHMSSMYKSNPHLSNEQQLKSPSIVNLISRSTRDLSNLGPSGNVTRREERYTTTTTSSGNSVVDGKRNIFLRDLREKSPELYKVINEEPLSHSYKLREREAFARTKSPVTINKDTASLVRRGSSSTEDYNETFNTTHHSTDPSRPGVTNTTESFSRKTLPTPDGRGQRTVESREVRSITTNRYRGSESPATLKYIDSVDRGSVSRNGVNVINIKRY